MADALKLAGGQLTRRDPGRLPLSPNAQAPFMRLVEPYDLYLSAGCLALLRRACALALGTPDPVWVEVAVREVEGQRYILIVPTGEENPRRVLLVIRPGGSRAILRTVHDVLLAGGVTVQRGWAYRMAAELAEDAELGWVVAGNFTAARLEVPRSRRAGGGAAPEQGPAAEGAVPGQAEE